MSWKKIKSVNLLRHPRLSVYEDQVELPNGLKTKYLHFGDIEDTTMIIAVNEEGKFLVQKEYSYPPNEMLYQFPGGMIEPGEDPKEGAKRELAEESGLGGDLTSVGWFYINNRRSSQKLYVYVAKNLYPAEAQKDPEEEFEEFWLTGEEIENLIVTNEIRNYTILSGWALYKAKKE